MQRRNLAAPLQRLDGWQKGRALNAQAAQKVMGAVFPPAPTFLGPIRLPVRAIFSCPGRIRIRFEDLAIPTPVPSRVSNQAFLPRRSPASLHRNISASSKPLSLSLRPKAPVPPDGPESGSGFGLRLCLTLLPRSPCRSLVFRSSLQTIIASAAAAASNFLPLPVVRSGCTWKVGLGTPPHKVNQPGDN